MSPLPLIFLLSFVVVTVDLAFPHVRGQVVSKGDGTPLPGATIEDERGKVVAVAAGDGTFEFRLPLPTDAFVTARAQGFATTRVPLPPKTRRMMMLPPLELSRGATLTVSLSGDAARARRIVLQHTGRNEEERNEREIAIEQQQTTAVFRDLPPASYRVVARGDEPLEAIGKAVTLKAGDEATVKLDIESFTLNLRVVHGERALPGAMVTFENNDVGSAGSVMTGSEGAVAARMFQRGNWLLVTEVPQLRQPHMSTAKIDDAESPKWSVVIPAKRIHGTLRDAGTGKPIADVSVDVQFYSRENGEPFSGAYATKTDTAGGYELSGVRDGRYVLAFRHREYRPADPVELRVEEWDERIERNALLERRTEAIRLNVVDATGAALRRTPVLVTPLPSHPDAVRSYETDDAGRVALDTIYGPVIAFAVPSDGSFGLVHLDPRRVGDEAIELRVPRPSSNLTLTVITKDSVPLQQLRIVMRWDGWMVPPSVIRVLERQPGNQLFTGTDGRIVLRGAPAGMYEIWPYRSREEAEDIVTAGVEAPIRLNVAPGDTRITVRVDRRR